LKSVKVSELASNSQMMGQQISEAQIIVTTPEKWDLVRLVIIDEIHLLPTSGVVNYLLGNTLLNCRVYQINPSGEIPPYIKV